MSQYSYKRPATVLRCYASPEPGMIPPDQQSTPRPHESQLPVEPHSSRFNFDSQIIDAEAVITSDQQFFPSQSDFSRGQEVRAHPTACFENSPIYYTAGSRPEQSGRKDISAKKFASKAYLSRKSPIIGAMIHEQFSPITSFDNVSIHSKTQDRIEDGPFSHILGKRFILIKIGRKYGMRTKRYAQPNILTSSLIQYKQFDGKKESGAVDLYQTSCFVIQSDQVLFGKFCLRIRRPDLKNPYRVYLRTPKQLEQMLRFCKLCSNRDLERYLRQYKRMAEGSFFSVQEQSQSVRPFEAPAAPLAPRHSKSNLGSFNGEYDLNSRHQELNKLSSQMYYPPQAYDPTLLYSKGVKGRTHIWDQDSDIELTSPPKKPYEKERSVSVLEELPPPSRKVYIPKKKESQDSVTAERGRKRDNDTNQRRKVNEYSRDKKFIREISPLQPQRAGLFVRKNFKKVPKQAIIKKSATQLEETKPKGEVLVIKPSKTTLRIKHQQESICDSDIFHNVNEGTANIDVSYFRERDHSAMRVQKSLFTEHSQNAVSPIHREARDILEIEQSFLSGDFEELAESEKGKNLRSPDQLRSREQFQVGMGMRVGATFNRNSLNQKRQTQIRTQFSPREAESQFSILSPLNDINEFSPREKPSMRAHSQMATASKPHQSKEDVNKSNTSFQVLKRRHKASSVLWQNKEPREFKPLEPTFSSQTCLQKGLERMWTFDLENALEYFKKYFNEDVRHALHYVEVEVLKVVLVGRNGELKYALKMIKALEKQLKEAKHLVKRGRDMCGGKYPLTLSNKQMKYRGNYQEDEENYRSDQRDRSAENAIPHTARYDPQTSRQSRSFFGDDLLSQIQLQMDQKNELEEEKQYAARDSNPFRSSPTLIGKQPEEDHKGLVTQTQFIELLEAESHLLKTIIHAFRSKKIDMFFQIKAAWDLYKQGENTFLKKYNARERTHRRSHRNEKELPECNSQVAHLCTGDIEYLARLKFGLGLVYLGISGLPNTMSFFVKLVGFKGDRERGIHYLTDCLSENGVRACYSGLLLSLYQLQIDGDVAGSAKVLKTCQNLYPDFVLQLWVTSIFQWKKSSLIKAQHILSKAIWTCGSILGQKVAYLQYELSWICFINLKWETSVQKFLSMLQNILKVDLYSASADTKTYIPAAPVVSNIPPELIAKTNSHISELHKSPGFRNAFLIKFITNRSKRHNDPGIQYMPHKACICFQTGASYAAIGDMNKAYQFLNYGITLVEHDKEVSCSKQDVKLGKLCSLYFHRLSLDFLPFEMLYFMSQFIKMPSLSLQAVVEKVTQILRNKYVDITKEFSLSEQVQRSPQLVEIISGGLIVVIIYHVLDLASLSLIFGERLIRYSKNLEKSSAHLYLVQHLYTWQARNYMVDKQYKLCEKFYSLAKKLKPCKLEAHKQLDALHREMKKVIKS